MTFREEDYMSKIKEAFDKILAGKKIPANYKEIENGHHLYRLQFKASETKLLMVEIIIQESEDPYVDSQIIYRHVHLLNDYNKRGEALDLINELNEMKTGYYTLHLAMDGEIFLRNIIRVGEDVTPLYETVVYGARIARGLIPALVEKLGKSSEIG